VRTWIGRHWIAVVLLLLGTFAFVLAGNRDGLSTAAEWLAGVATADHEGVPLVTFDRVALPLRRPRHPHDDPRTA
jgi:hypothetical protein